MRRLVIVGGAVVTVAAVAFGVVFRGDGLGRAKSGKMPHAMSAADAGIQAQARTTMEGLVVGQLARADLTHRRLEALDQRLQAMEAARATAEPPAPATDSDSDSDSDSDDEGSAPKPLSEGALGDWMRASLRRGNGNRDWTLKAESQVQRKLSELPGLDIEAVECGDRFGRVTFFRADGAPPDVLPLLGQPPFDNEAFTAPNEDGSVSIYFTAPGVRIEELRSEAAPKTG